MFLYMGISRKILAASTYSNSDKYCKNYQTTIFFYQTYHEIWVGSCILIGY